MNRYDQIFHSQEVNSTTSKYYFVINSPRRAYKKAELPIPKSYDKAYKKVLNILYTVIVFLSDPTTKEPHIAAPTISPHVAPTLRFAMLLTRGTKLLY